MLYDPKWEADRFTLESLIAWLEKQPARRTYIVILPKICLLGQFATAMGHPEPGRKSVALEMDPGFSAIAILRPHTFGAALERARLVAGTAALIEAAEKKALEG